MTEESFFREGKADPVSCGFYMLCWVMISIGIIACIVGFLAPSATALNMSVTDLGYTGAQTIEIFSSTGVLQGTYNTSSNGILLPTEDFYLVIKPTTANRDLGDNLTAALGWFVTYWYVVGFTLFVVYLAIGGRRR